MLPKRADMNEKKGDLGGFVGDSMPAMPESGVDGERVSVRSMSWPNGGGAVLSRWWHSDESETDFF